MTWRDNLLPASFRGVPFKVESGSRTGGRRLALHEFPKRNEPYAEDMGRRGRRFPVTGYVIGEDFQALALALATALDAEGAGTLVHPTMGAFQVKCESFTQHESRDKGRVVDFEMNFVEAGSAPTSNSGANTAAAVQPAADAANSASSAEIDDFLKRQKNFTDNS